MSNSAFAAAGDIEDSTILSFSFNITDPTVRGIRFDVVFGSDEYPEFVNSLFNGAVDQPLSIIEKNLQIGNFVNNANGAIPIEYDGVPRVLSVLAPVQQGNNTIKIGVADTGDEILDSGLFISNLHGVSFSGFGLAPVLVQAGGNQQPVIDTVGNQLFTFANAINSQINLVNTLGNDVVDRINAFVTTSFANTLGQIQSYSFANNVLELVTATGTKLLLDVERVKLQDAYFAFDTAKGKDTWQAYALLKAGFDVAPSQALLSQWVKQADAAPSMGALVKYLYGTLAGITATQAQVDEFANQMGAGKTFATAGDLFAFDAGLDINTNTF